MAEFAKGENVSSQRWTSRVFGAISRAVLALEDAEPFQGTTARFIWVQLIFFTHAIEDSL